MITLTEVCNVHAVALGKVWDVAPHPHAHESESPGNFRSHDIQPFAGGMTSPAHTLVPMEIKGWVDRVNAIGPGIVKDEHAIEQVPEMLAGIHVRFEQIHPFLDGNGRTGRLALNLILVRLGWPPAIILKAQRARYLKALDRADHDDLGSLAEIIARSVIDNLHRLIPNIAGPAKYVPLEALVDDEFSLAALKQAATRGRLEAIIGPDGRYRSSKAALGAYKASKYSRRR